MSKPIYMSHLTDAGLHKLVAVWRHYYDKAPALFGWLSDITHREQYRRVAGRYGREVAPEILDGFPAAWLDWSDEDVGQALKVLTALSYGISSELTASVFIDRLVTYITGMAANRLRTNAVLEEHYACDS